MRSAPVLFIIFNRPDTTQKVFDRIRQATPERLYVVSDAARTDRVGEEELVNAARDIIEQQVDWDCKVSRHYAKNNLGCGVNVSQGITWFFQHEEAGIILEDDCLPSPVFFDFCSDMLNKHADSERVMHISGSRYNEEFEIEDDFFYSQYAHIWGWATWRRSWQHFQLDPPELRDGVHVKHVHSLFSTKKERDFWKVKLRKGVLPKLKNQWGVQWQYAVSQKSGLCVTPKENLISNIGAEGVHTHSGNQFLFRKVSENFGWERQPGNESRNAAFDDYHFSHHFKPYRSLVSRILKKLKLT